MLRFTFWVFLSLIVLEGPTQTLVLAASQNEPAIVADTVPNTAAEAVAVTVSEADANSMSQSVTNSDGLPKHAVPLNPEKTIFFDRPGSRLWLETAICLREGQLEMLICPKLTKEHESILHLDGAAQTVHAGLMALGAKPGKPATFTPEFQAASGTDIQIFVHWQDEKGTWKRTAAQNWVRHVTQTYFSASLPELPADFKLIRGKQELTYDRFSKELVFFGPMSDLQKEAFRKRSSHPDFHRALDRLAEQGKVRPLTAQFVFAGSRFARQANGQEVYQAETGSLVCVANFADAMIDLNAESTASQDSGLLFEPWTERLPELDAKVFVELIPILEKSSSGSTSLDAREPATVLED